MSDGALLSMRCVFTFRTFSPLIGFVLESQGFATLHPVLLRFGLSALYIHSC